METETNNGTNTTIEMAFNWHEIGFIRSFDILFHNAIVAFVKIHRMLNTHTHTHGPKGKIQLKMTTINHWKFSKTEIQS